MSTDAQKSTDLRHVSFSPEGEEWIEYGARHDRRRVGFHDYAAIYSVPGLYERVFVEELGMRSTPVVVELYAAALRRLGRDPARERVLDLGAGSGFGGELLRREEHIGAVVGLDLEPAARDAAGRDHPGTYEDFLVADLSAAPEVLSLLAAQDFTALIAMSAIGAGHIPLDVLAETVQRVLRPGGLFAFAIAAELVPTFFDEFFALVQAERLDARSYVHRRRTDGSPDHATAIVAQLG